MPLISQINLRCARKQKGIRSDKFVSFSHSTKLVPVHRANANGTMTHEEAMADVHPDFDPLEQDIGVIRPSDAVATRIWGQAHLRHLPASQFWRCASKVFDLAPLLAGVRANRPPAQIPTRVRSASWSRGLYYASTCCLICKPNPRARAGRKSRVGPGESVMMPWLRDE